MAEVVDSIIVELIARTEQYQRNILAATETFRKLRAELEKPIDESGGEKAAAGAKQRAQGTAQAEEQATASIKRTRKARTDDEIAAAERSKIAERERVAVIKQAVRDEAKAKADAAKASADAVKAGADAEVSATVAAERIKRAEAAETRKILVAEAEAARLAAGASVGGLIGPVDRRPLQAAATAANAGGGVVAAQNAEMRATSVASGAASAEANVAATAAAKERALIEAEINDRTVAQLGLKAQIIGADKADAAVLQDQLFALQQFGRYRALGLDEASAQVRVDTDLLAIEEKRVRVAAEQAALVEKQMQAQSGAIASKISGAGLLTGALVGGLGVAEISHLNDRYIELSNSLKVAGVSASEFDAVQQHLLATANKNGTNINALADVFRSASLGAHDLGLSQKDLLTITDAASNSLRIQGVSSEKARGSLLSLGHALETPRVNAREFNSLALNMYPLLQAAAQGADKFGGSVTKLREAIIAGNVSGGDLAKWVIAGAKALEERAGKATLTTAQGFTSLTNALVVYFGEADKAQGVSAALGAALQKLGQNLDTLIPAIAAIGTALAVGYVTRMTLAATATQSFGAAVLGAFGGPVGLAITAVGLAFAAMAVEINKASAETESLNQSIDAQAAKFATVREAHARAAAETDNLTNSERLALTATAALTGEADKLATAWGRVAAQAKEAAIQQAKTDLDLANSTVRRAQTDLNDRKTEAFDGFRGTSLGIAGAGYTPLSSPTKFVQTATSANQQALDRAQAVQRDAQANLKEVQQRGLVTFRPAPGSDLSLKTQAEITKLTAKIAGLEKIADQQSGKQKASTEAKITKANEQLDYLKQGIDPAAARAGSSSGAGRAGPSADTLAKRQEAARLKDIHEAEAYTTELKQAHDRELQAQVDLSDSVEERADLERQRVRDAAAEQDHNDRLKGPKNPKNDPKINGGVDGTGERTAAQTQSLIDTNARTVALKVDAIDKAKRQQDATDALSIDDANLDIQKAALQAQEGIADTLAERRKIAGQILDIEFKEKEKALQATLSKDSRATPAERIIAQRQLDALPGQKASAQDSLDRANQGAGRAYADSFSKDPKQIVEGAEVKVLQDFNSGLDQTVTKALHLHGIFGDIVNDLVEMAIKQALIAPVANTLFPAAGTASGGGGVGGFFGSLISNIGSAFGIGGAGASLTKFVGGANANLSASMPSLAATLSGARASGGPVNAGGTYLVGEKGPELLRLGGQGGNIVPNNALGTMSPNTRAAAPQIAGPTINQTIQYSGAVDVADKAYVNQIAALQHQATKQAIADSGRQTLAATPAVIRRKQTLGS